MSSYKTNASCVLSVIENGRPAKLPGRLVDISTDGAQVLCERALPVGIDVRIQVDGIQGREKNSRIISNQGNSGDGYRLSCRLLDGSWPYDVFVALTTMAVAAPAAGRARPNPPCLEELGLALPSTIDEIEQAFAKKVRSAHPDRGGDVETFVRLRTAYLQALDLLGGSR